MKGTMEDIRGITAFFVNFLSCLGVGHAVKHQHVMLVDLNDLICRTLLF